MKKKNLFALVGALALVASVGIGSTLAYFTDSETIGNVVTMGNVNISLTEDSSENAATSAKVTKEEDGSLSFKEVVPGDTLSKIVTVKNIGANPAYIRVKVSVNWTKEINQAIDDSIIVFSKDFVKGEDGYYYYQNVLEKDAEVNVFEEVVIPGAEWTNVVADEEFKIDIVAEAIQSENFKPAETATGIINGWGEVSIEDYK